MAENVQPGDWVAGPFWEAAVQVVGLATRDGYDVVTVAGRNQEPTRTYVVTPTDWEQIIRSARADRRHIRFSGDASRFRLSIQAHRLRLAHSIDPYAALNASRIDLLLHQTEAVQSHLLAYDLEIKSAINLSKLSGESSITLDLKLELEGNVNDHSVQMALREIQQRVGGLVVGDAKGK